MKTVPRTAKTILSPLFDLAPGGACPAVDIAVDAVRSYRTISPLLCRAVYFLLRYP